MKHGWYGDTETTVALKAWLATHWQYYPVELYDVALPSFGYPTPLTLRWTDQPFDVTYPTPDTTATTLAVYAGGGHVGVSGNLEPAPKLSRGTRKDVIGVEVDELELSILLDGTEFLPPADGAAPLPFGIAEAIRAGLHDGASVTVRRAIVPAPPLFPIEPDGLANRGDLGPGDLSLGAVTLFGGIITKSDVSRSKASLTVRSALEKLSVGMPRNVFQAGCLNDLYDGLCGVSRTGSFGGNTFQQAAAQTGTYAGTAQTALLTTSYPTDTPVAHPDDYFRFGSLQVTSGAMAGLKRSVRAHAAYSGDPNVTAVELLQPLPRALEDGAAVLLQAGCAKTLSDCETKFDNFFDTNTIDIDGTTYSTNGLRFRGFVRVPPPDSAI